MRTSLLKAVALSCVSLLLLNACGGGAETKTNAQPPNQPVGIQPYAGPDPRTDTIQEWRINVWENLRAGDDGRCSRCHVPGVQAPFFMRDDNINDAYSAFFPYVDTGAPFDSEVVTKLANDHNCWLPSDVACADVMLGWIEDWLTAGGQSVGRQIQISPIDPQDLQDITAAKQFPVSSGAFASSQLYTDLQTWCSDCHNSAADDPRKPFFAEGTPDIAYSEVLSKVNLSEPSLSRVVERPRDESHGCPQQLCDSYADQLEQDIIDFAAGLDDPVVDDTLVASKALVIADDGIIAAGGNRYEDDLIALYEFKTGSDFLAVDTSGIDPPMNLTISEESMWMSNWGLTFDGQSQKAQALVEDSTKLYDLIGITGEYTVEAWVTPGNVTQEEARIISYSGGTDRRNFTMGQTLYNYDFFNRSVNTDNNGEAALSTADADEDLQANLQYVVMTYTPNEGRRIYVNGVWTGDADPVASGSIGNWDDTFALVLGNEVSGNRGWAGQVRMLAIHNRAFDQAQIDQNYAVQPGQKYFLIFNVDEWTQLTDSYIMFEASQYDQYSYLFSEPRFIMLGDNTDPGTQPVRGMRIGINGQIPNVGQAFGNLDATVTTLNYPSEGYLLSRLGTILPLQYGLELDQFFLSFEELGTGTDFFTDLGSITPAADTREGEAPVVGVRLFDEIYATMADITGIYSTGPDNGDDYPEVTQTYQSVRQQLPATPDADGFLGAHQAGIAQIAIEYCNALVDDPLERAIFWEDFVFPVGNPSPVNVTTYLGTDTQRDDVIDPLVTKLMGANLSSQPAVGTVNDTAPELIGDDDNNPATIKPGMTIKGELNALITDLSACGTSCPQGRVETIVKATCSAALGNAGIVMQ